MTRIRGGKSAEDENRKGEEEREDVRGDSEKVRFQERERER